MNIFSKVSCMTKLKTVFILTLISLTISSCSQQKLPVFGEESQAVLVIPTNVVNRTNNKLAYSLTVILERVDEDAESSDQEISKKVFFKESVPYALITDLTPGSYEIHTLKQVRRPGLRSRIVNRDAEYSFSLEKGKITLLPAMFTVSQYRNNQGGYWFSFTHRRLFDFERNRYKRLLSKEENINMWELDI